MKDGKSLIIEELAQAPESSREEILTNFLVGLLSAVLGSESSQEIDRKQTFFYLGIDSLLVASLKKKLESSLGISNLPTTLIFDYPTIETLATHLIRNYLKFEEADLPGSLSNNTKHSAEENYRENLANLSENEIAKMLAEKLKELRN